MKGDSGGPFACAAPLGADSDDDQNIISNEIGEIDSKSKFTLWGITSYGGNARYACSGTDGVNAGIYTRVEKYMDWIVNQFKRNNVNPNA